MEQHKYRQNIIISIFIIIFCLFMLFIAIPKEISTETLWAGSSTGVDSATFPKFASVIILIAAVLELVTNTKRYLEILKHEPRTKSDTFCISDEVRALLVFGCCIIYAVLFKSIGYMLATLISTTLVLIVLRDFKWKHYISVYCTAVVMYFIFKYLLNINLP